MKEHPEQVPTWAQEIHPWDVVALGRYIIWGWVLDDAGGELMRAGIVPDAFGYHGSNELLLGPGRTALKVPIAVIDPAPELVWRVPLLPGPDLRRGFQRVRRLPSWARRCPAWATAVIVPSP